ncbi:plasma membrane ATPase 1-like [Dorcoceras hygrometricum]|uniref:Plasma membrane ATPase 1-like n=1 Tax=Dorcoceras hygrometricum TaxID=472368 RepID=A0A2Z7DAX4_9LAMI|nr:plasma membrane ATPase 1-like [Dorcoceras hygrometricum]
MFLVDWAVKMRIRPLEFETSICDAKYHVSLSTTSVLGKCVYLVTLAMSLFDLQDVRIAIGSIATLDLPMVVDLIGIYGLKGPYCTLTTTNWFLQALSVIPRGSWGDVARSFTMIRWAAPPLLSQRAAAAASSPEFVPAKLDEENPSAHISSRLLVHGDEGVSRGGVIRIPNSGIAYDVAQAVAHAGRSDAAPRALLVDAWSPAGRTLKAAGRTTCARPCVAFWRGSRAAAAIFVVVAPPSPAAAPASLQ